MNNACRNEEDAPSREGRPTVIGLWLAGGNHKHFLDLFQNGQTETPPTLVALKNEQKQNKNAANDKAAAMKNEIAAGQALMKIDAKLECRASANQHKPCPFLFIFSFL